MPLNVFNDTSFDPSAHVGCPVEEIKVVRIYCLAEMIEIFSESISSFVWALCASSVASVSRVKSFVLKHETTQSMFLRARVLYAFVLTYWTHLSLALVVLYQSPSCLRQILAAFERRRPREERRVTRAAAAQQASRVATPRAQPAQPAQPEQPARPAQRAARTPPTGRGRRGARTNREYDTLYEDWREMNSTNGITETAFVRLPAIRDRFAFVTEGALLAAIARRRQ